MNLGGRQFIYYFKTRNAWQSLACSPRGIVV